MRSSFRFILAALVGLAFSLPTTSSAADMDAIYRAAKKEGKVVFYSYIKKKISRKIGKLFKKKYPGVKYGFTRKGTSKQIPAIEAEILAKRIRVDVMINTNPQSFLRWKRTGFLAKWKAPNDKFLDPVYVDPDGYYRSGAMLLMVGAYNPKKVKPGDVPKSYKELLSPKWKNKLVSSTPRKSGVDYPKYLLLEGALGTGFLKGLAKNNMLLIPGQGSVLRMVLKGERQLAVGTSSYRVFGAIKKGKPVKPIFWKEGTVLIYTRMGFAKKAKHPNASKLLINFFLSKENQKLLVKNYLYSPRTDVGPPKGSPALSQIKILKATDVQLRDVGRANFADKFDRVFGLK